MKKCLVVYNPNSGKYNKEVTLPKIEKILNEYDYSVIIEKTKYKGDATSIVANIDKCDLVVSIGGDGTFNEVMTGNFMNIPYETPRELKKRIGHLAYIKINVLSGGQNESFPLYQALYEKSSGSWHIFINCLRRFEQNHRLLL